VSEGIAWEEPPPSRTSNYPWWVEIADALRARPGHWAKIKSDASRTRASQMAAYVRSANGPFAGGQWEAVTRIDLDHREQIRVYARYLGPADPSG